MIAAGGTARQSRPPAPANPSDRSVDGKPGQSKRGPPWKSDAAEDGIDLHYRDNQRLAKGRSVAIEIPDNAAIGEVLARFAAETGRVKSLCTYP